MTLGSSERATVRAAPGQPAASAPTAASAAAAADDDPIPAATPSLRAGLVASVAVNSGVTLVGAVGIWLSIQLGVGSPTEPGPGLWPLTAAAVMTAAGLVTVVSAVLGERVASLRGSARPAVGLVLCAVFVLLFSFVSVIVAMAVTMALWTRLLGGLSWAKVALSTVVVTTALYLIFGVAIETPFPAPLTFLP